MLRSFPRLTLLAGLVAWSPVQTTPSEVVQAFYKACNEGKYSVAEALATKETVDYLKNTMSMAGGLRGYCDAMTEEGTLTKVEILTERIRGEGARISLKFHYKSAPEETGEETLLKTPAGWRIQVLGQGK
ncbi:MAG: DUF4878 domain-containing protein [Gemmatimonadetes bacterium]|nr:DUF4878 domain-containing protein [Gemmatimonadota bacterium]